jgi:hypothetical protein
MLATATYHAAARRPRPEPLQARPAKQIMLAARAADRTRRMHARLRT